MSSTPPPVSNVLDDNSWSTIKWVSNHNLGSNYWSVGATKKITMNGKVSDGLTLTNFETYVYILGFNHNEALEGSGIVFGGFKTAQTGGIDICLIDSASGAARYDGQWFNVNNSLSNTGGWQSSLMRTVTMPLIKAAFPVDLQAVIKASTIYTDNTGGGAGNVVPTATQDEVFLLAEYEIFGTNSYATTQEANYLKQYAYYSAGNSKVKRKHNATGTDAYWWERSPGTSDSNFFCVVATNGLNYYSATYGSNGVAPAFRV